MRVRVVGIKRYTDHTGRKRAYWRRKGAPSIPINPDLTGAELAAEVAKLEQRHLAPKAKAGTLRQLVVAYKTNSNHWRQLSKRTRKDYERVFAWLGDAIDTPCHDIDSVEMAKTRDKARDKHEPKFANQVVTTLKMVFRYGLEIGDMRSNPAEGLEKAVRTRTDSEDDDALLMDAAAAARANRPLSPAELVAIIDNAPPKLLAGIVCGFYFSLREGDVVRLLKSAIDGDWMTTLQGKSRRMGKPAKAVTVYVCEDAKALLKQTPKNEAVTIAVKSDGTPWTLEGWKTAWGLYRDALEKKELIKPGVTFHGLRHTGPTWLEDEGYDETQTRHQLGHGPRSVSGHYGATAERKKLLKELGLVLQEKVRVARGNVVPIRNRSV